MSNPLIVVTGATGTVGSRVVKHLAEAGHSVRALVRDPAKAASLNRSAEFVVADLSKPETLEAAFTGADKAFVVAPPAANMELMAANALEAARQAGVKHVVYLSNFGAGKFGPSPVWNWHAAGESRLQALNVAWTILKPARFMTNTPFPFSWHGIKELGVLTEPTGAGRMSVIDPGDVAAVAAKLLTAGGHDGKIYQLTSSDLLTGEQIAAKIGAAIGKAVRFDDPPPDEIRAALLSKRAPDFVVESVLRYFETVREGRWHTTGAVSEILGRPPRTYDTWLRDNAATFQ
jgi:uncharacterized protein YbjT (DUF2867 family)